MINECIFYNNNFELPTEDFSQMDHPSQLNHQEFTVNEEFTQNVFNLRSKTANESKISPKNPMPSGRPQVFV